MRIGSGTHQVDHLVDTGIAGAPCCTPRKRQPPPVPVDSHTHDVDTADPHPWIETAALGQVADVPSPVTGGAAEDIYPASGQGDDPEHGLDQRGLA